MDPFDLLRYFVGVVEKLGLRYFVTGSAASMFFGEYRTTNDVDVVVDLPVDRIAELIAEFPPDDYYISEDAIRWAIKHRSQFNILDPKSGFKIDVIIPGDDAFDRACFSRAIRGKPEPDFEVWYTSVEDIILRKMRFFQEGESEKHLRDIATMLKVQRDRIDRPYIEKWVQQLGLDEIWQQLKKITQ